MKYTGYIINNGSGEYNYYRPGAILALNHKSINVLHVCMFHMYNKRLKARRSFPIKKYCVIRFLKVYILSRYFFAYYGSPGAAILIETNFKRFKMVPLARNNFLKDASGAEDMSLLHIMEFGAKNHGRNV